MFDLQVKIIGTGSYLPEKIVTNHELAQLVDTSDEWITERTGIKARHKIADHQTTSDLATQAARKAIAAASIDANDIDMIICATTTADLIFPSTASIIQQKLDIHNHCAAFDIQAVCAGFMFAMDMAYQYMLTKKAKTILVIGAEALTRLLDYSDRTTCVLFGDGAGAMVLQADATPQKTGILSTHIQTNGHLNHILKCKGGPGTHDLPFGYLTMEGKEVFRNAVQYLSQIMQEVIDIADLVPEDIDYIVPHQANQRIMDATAKKVGISPDKVISTIAHHGNTSAASIPLAFDEAVRKNIIQPGHTVLMEAIGGGMSWGGAIVKM